MDQIWEQFHANSYWIFSSNFKSRIFFLIFKIDYLKDLHFIGNCVIMYVIAKFVATSLILLIISKINEDL